MIWLPFEACRVNIKVIVTINKTKPTVFVQTLLILLTITDQTSNKASVYICLAWDCIFAACRVKVKATVIENNTVSAQKLKLILTNLYKSLYMAKPKEDIALGLCLVHVCMSFLNDTLCIEWRSLISFLEY